MVIFGYPIDSYSLFPVHLFMTFSQHFFVDKMSDRRKCHFWQGCFMNDF